MDAIEMLTGRRSIRKYKDEVVPQDTLKDIIEISKYAPSWANFQIARYNFISDQEIISKIAEKGVNSFVYNKSTLKNAKKHSCAKFCKREKWKA